MTLLTCMAADCGQDMIPNGFHGEPSQRERIVSALGTVESVNVDDETLARYYEYLSAKLSFPFVAYYPEPTTAQEERELGCIVIELIDPMEHLGDKFDGIFCKVWKGRYEFKLPLIELQIPQDSPNFQLIEDYWYWFWNWR